MAVYFTNPVLAQQRMADDQLPMQQEALRLQELAQLLQASQQNQRTQSEERQNRERVGAQRFQTETYGDVARGQNEIGRRKAENDILQGINELALRRDQLNQQAEQFRIQAGLSKDQMLNALEIAKINAGRSPLRSQEQAEILLNNADIEAENAAAQRAIAAVKSLASQLQAKDEENLASEWLTSKAEAKEKVAAKAPSGIYIQEAINQLSQANPEIGKMLVPSGTNVVQLNQRRPITFGPNPALTTPLQSTNAQIGPQFTAPQVTNVLDAIQSFTNQPPTNAIPAIQSSPTNDIISLINEAIRMEGGNPITNRPSRSRFQVLKVN